MVAKTAYLGVIIGYRAWETNTTARRIQAPQHCFSILKRWLEAQSIPAQVRFRLYYQCVMPTVLYGVHEMELPISCCKRLANIINVHLKCMIRSPVHLTHENTTDFFHRLGVKAPWTLIADHHHRLTTALDSKHQSLMDPDVPQPDVCTLNPLYALSAINEYVPPTPPVPRPPWPSPSAIDSLLRQGCSRNTLGNNIRYLVCLKMYSNLSVIPLKIVQYVDIASTNFKPYMPYVNTLTVVHVMPSLPLRRQGGAQNAHTPSFLHGPHIRWSHLFEVGNQMCFLQFGNTCASHDPSLYGFASRIGRTSPPAVRLYCRLIQFALRQKDNALCVNTRILMCTITLVQSCTNWPPFRVILCTQSIFRFCHLVNDPGRPHRTQVQWIYR